MNDLGYTFNSLIEGLTLNFQILPCNIIGTYQSEDIYTIIYGTCPSSPNSFKLNKINIINSDNNKYNVYLSWNAVTDNGGTPIIKYTLYLSFYGIQYYSHNLNIPTYSIASYLITNLIIGNSYYVKISAYNSIGSSEEYIDSFIPSSVPSNPLNVIVSNANNQIINLEWEKPINNYGLSITSYVIYYLVLTSRSSTTQRLETNSIINSYSLTSLQQMFNIKYL